MGITPEREEGWVHELSQRNAIDVCGTIRTTLAANPDLLFQQAIPARSLLGVALGRTIAARKQAVPPTGETGFVVDRGKFEVRFNGSPCFLGNTLEFRFLEYLNQRRGTYTTIQQIADDVWEKDQVNNNSIQRVVSSIRRQFRTAEIDDVEIQGGEDGHYRLQIPSG